MGNCSSHKSESPKGRVSTKARPSHLDWDSIMSQENDGGAMSQKSYDQVEVAKMKKELLESPQIFVLNNLLMSVMFFENYEREKQKFTHSTIEKELNPTLLRDETIECVIPDVIFENVHKNVKFRRMHGPNKNKIEPLVPRRYFVVNDNIEVLETKNTPQYSAIDKPGYQVVVEKSEEHFGFVKLKCAPSQARTIEPEPALDKKDPKPGPSTQTDDSEIYEYSTIASVNTPKPLDITSCERRDTLPKTCFTQKRIRKYEETSDDSDEEEEAGRKVDEAKELYDVVSYISSNGFMKYIQNAVFPNSLGLALGFDASEIALAKAIPGKIFCNLQDVNEDFAVLPCEIVPSVAIQWPIEFTFEFHNRAERPTMWDKFGEEYKWPKLNMINEIRGLSCALVPRGYIPKRGENPDSEIEWEIAFPKAQRYLDTHMSHTQIRAFLFLLTIYKSFIEPVNKQYDGLLVDHFRTHMYWECESNPRDWPEHRLGTKLAIVIRNFMQKLSVGELPDFFIKKKNMFLNVPNKHLRHAQKILHDVLESPAIYFLGALRNLKYTNPKFYPHFDFKELYRLLTADTSLMVNPRIVRPPNLIPKNRQMVKVEGDANYRREIKWKIEKEKQMRKLVMQKRREQEQREENLKMERRGSVDSIDYELQCEQQFDRLKIREILMFFIRHFIEMARKSRRLASQRQALFYLKQAYYLGKILEDFGLQADARELLEQVTKEEETSKKISVSESFEFPPSTPKRNSAQFSWEMTQQVKGNNINLNNLNKSTPAI
ncbi:hypothetical protein TcasGA2_TC012093 [Tribolium castaneum]|uniref:Mab-21-like HhH/H2TH-like domain-containing protein n=1 Tax=Tribolium castaneum TaxID=7070 RepID=D6X208_TRICA|nr:hypothetical protein TcasGA2_TC012093 [Tribolium castaneum]